MPFTRMDQGKIEDWMQIGAEVARRQTGMPAIIKGMLLELERQVNGFAINQLQHGLQTATRALRDGASEEVVVAALCHDIGKVISVENHPAIAAEIIKPYVSRETYEIVRTHQDFQGRHYYALVGKDPEARRPVRGPALVRAGHALHRRVGPDILRPGLRHAAAFALRADDRARLRPAAARHGGRRINR